MWHRAGSRNVKGQRPQQDVNLTPSGRRPMTSVAPVVNFVVTSPLLNDSTTDCSDEEDCSGPTPKHVRHVHAGNLDIFYLLVLNLQCAAQYTIRFIIV